MNEIITGIRILKMYAWEKPFSAIIYQLRGLEVQAFVKRLQLRGFFFIMLSFSSKFFVFVTVLVYVLVGNDLAADKVFFTSSVYVILGVIWVTQIPTGISGFAEIVISMKRVEVLYCGNIYLSLTVYFK